ncbi:2'-5' RNA ligase family protein [Nakamurella flavida]|uniref:2'-5' RNA ligase family protein n=1 Tax=Nakamurella flavida TaxID=363630 RepID=A0A939C2V2_9ACTN|nr:2'-5' RNA ligase family protein [Nakamurella flavida]MBM9476416.1 2'-5' RNA ligase family protein [Nakamurella flavida]MDP9779483.1 2'-5' RNA ligase [Nakamurella flavida]
MVQSVELLFEGPAEECVREQWAVLEAAGLPSQARHTAVSNRPHVTLAVAEEIPHAVERDIAAAVGDLPLELVLGGLLVFGSRSCVLARLVLPTAELLELQARLAAVLEQAGIARRPHLEPGRWTPHVTLARRMRPEQLGEAVGLVGDDTAVEILGHQVRRWDSDARRTWTVLP